MQVYLKFHLKVYLFYCMIAKKKKKKVDVSVIKNYD